MEKREKKRQMGTALLVIAMAVAVVCVLLAIIYGYRSKRQTDAAAADHEVAEEAAEAEKHREKADESENTALAEDTQADDERAAVVDAPAKTKPYQEVTPYNAWTTAQVNFRAAPSTESEKLGVLARRTEVSVCGELDEWRYVLWDGQYGYISSGYLTDTMPTDNGFVVVIDPGHQRSGDSAQEPNGPGASVMKARVTGGTRGTTTGIYEYELNLNVSLLLRDELEGRGYIVYMTRETHDVNISNMERAQYATEVGADIAVRIHANGAESSGTNGALGMAPSASNPYISYLSADSQRLAKCVLDSYCANTGFSNLGVTLTDTMTGINWSTVPVMILEMGFMTNPSDDTSMNNAAMQAQMAEGIANGIDQYFGL